MSTAPVTSGATVSTTTTLSSVADPVFVTCNWYCTGLPGVPGVCVCTTDKDAAGGSSTAPETPENMSVHPAAAVADA